jgi:hypothetical protein
MHLHSEVQQKVCNLPPVGIWLAASAAPSLVLQFCKVSLAVPGKHWQPLQDIQRQLLADDGPSFRLVLAGRVPASLQEQPQLLLKLHSSYGSTACELKLLRPKTGWPAASETRHTSFIANVPLPQLYQHVFVRSLFVGEKEPATVYLK